MQKQMLLGQFPTAFIEYIRVSDKPRDICRVLEESFTIQYGFMVFDNIVVPYRSHKPNLIDSILFLQSAHCSHVCLLQGIDFAIGVSLCPIHCAIRALAKGLLDLQMEERDKV